MGKRFVYAIAVIAALFASGVHSVMAQTGPQPMQQSVSFVSLNTKTSVYPVIPHARGFSATDQTMTFEKALTEFRAGRGKIFTGEQIILGYGTHGYWLLFNVDNRSQGKSRWMLDFGNRRTGTLGVVDRLMIFSDRDFTSPFMSDGRLIVNKLHVAGQERNAVPLTLEPGQGMTIGIYVEPAAKTPLALDLRIEEQATYTALSDKITFENTTLLAATLLVAGIFLLFWRNYRQSTPAFLFLYLIANYLIFITSDEIVSQGNNTRVQFLDILYALSCFAALSITFQLFEKPMAEKNLADSKQPRKNNKLRILAAAKVAIAALALFATIDPSSGYASLALMSLMPAATAVLIIALGMGLIREEPHHQVALLYTGAWAILLAGMTLTGAAAAGLTGYSVAAINLQWLCFALHLSLLSFASLRYMTASAETARQERVESRRRQEDEQERRKTRELADQTRLLGVLQREKELMADLRNREAERIQALRRAKEVADQANKAKSDFLAVISHEIRTPMTGIMGMIRLLMDTSMDDRQKEFAQTIQYSGEALLTLLNDILDLSKAEEGKMSLEIVDFDLGKLIESVALLMSGRAEEKKIRLKTDVDPETPLLLKGDPTRLRQILLNLVSNAIKFTDQGAVTITVRTHDKTPKKPRIYFAVSDTGIGISEEAQKKLFTPYSQADVSISRNFGGTGLGLAICKRLVEAMGGLIQIKSEPKQGTTFYFILSLDHGAPPEQVAPETRQAVTPLKILVVDDNVINQRVVAGLLDRDGHDIVRAGSAEAAIKEIQTGHFDVVLMDVEMPVIDGLRATQMIRALPVPEKASVPVIAMTAHAGKDDIKRCHEAGMNDHLSKPINPDVMRKMLSNISKKQPLAGDALQGEIKKTPPTPPIPSKASSPPQTLAAKKAAAIPKAVASPVPTEISTAAPLSLVPELANQQKLFNIEILGSLKDSLGKAQMDEMMDGLYQKTEELIAAAEAAAATGDAAALIARGHDIKGMTANFGLTTLSGLAARLERQGKEKFPIKTLAEIVTLLRPTYYDTRAALEKWLKN